MSPHDYATAVSETVAALDQLPGELRAIAGWNPVAPDSPEDAAALLDALGTLGFSPALAGRPDAAGDGFMGNALAALGTLKSRPGSIARAAATALARASDAGIMPPARRLVSGATLRRCGAAVITRSRPNN